ncbi:hypothetical protein [Escherichia coli]
MAIPVGLPSFIYYSFIY